MSDPLQLNAHIRRLVRDELRPLEAQFGDGSVATVEGNFAAIRKGDPEGPPTPGFFVPPHITLAVDDHVWYYDAGGFKLVLMALNRNVVLPDDLTLHNLVIAGSLQRTGILSPPALTANTNDWAPDGWADASIVRISQTGGPWSLTGMLPGTERDLVNVSAANMTLKHDVTSAVGSRLLGPGGDFLLVPNAAAHCWHDDVSDRWRIFAK